MTQVHRPFASLHCAVAWSLAGLLVGLVGCRSQERELDKAEREQLTMEMFQELVQQGTLTPIGSMEDAFGEFRPEMGATPEDYGSLEGEPGVAGPGPGSMAAGPEPLDPAAPTVEPDPPAVTVPGPPPNYYQIFGPRIIVHEATGLITKPFPMRSTSGTSLMTFLTKYADFPFWNGEGVQPAGTVYVEQLVGQDVEFLSQDMRKAGPAPGKDIMMGDWIVVTAGPELLQEVEAFIDTFAGGPPQIEIEAKIVEIGFQDSLDLGVKTDGTPMFDFGDSNFVKSFSSETPNMADVSEALLAIGGVQDGLAFNAILEAVATHDNVSIISRPKIAVREGGRAEITNTQRLPILDITALNPSGGFNAKVSYQEVGVKMYVVPRVVGTDTVALHIDIEASQQSGSEPILISGANEVVSIPVLSIRKARTIVYLQPGQAVILGGLITERNVEAVRKVPILGDIPVLNLLFRSKFTRKEQANVLFFIRPRILQGADMNRDF